MNWSMAFRLLERDLLPDRLIRMGIRRLLAERLRIEATGGVEKRQERLKRFAAELSESPVAVETSAANEQHYEVPSQFFELVLGKHLKYSSGYWPEGVSTLDGAEEAMLEIYGKRAGVEDGHDILELGCGWGSLSLWLAERFPRSSILAVSNSSSQRRFIETRMLQRGIGNLEVVTQDMNEFATDRRFDRVVSIEMFEHMKNYRELMRRIAGWLKPGGKLFVHIFAHREFAYPYETSSEDDWMGRHFFTGGNMPSTELLLRFQEALTLEEDWVLSGKHYQRTADAWLDHMDSNRERIRAIFEDTYGAADTAKWLARWRTFFMSCSELWGYSAGDEWVVAHYLFGRKVLSAASSDRADDEAKT